MLPSDQQVHIFRIANVKKAAAADEDLNAAIKRGLDEFDAAERSNDGRFYKDPGSGLYLPR